MLKAQIKRLNALGGLVTRAAPEIADAMGREISGNIARGVGPDGKPWPETKDGQKPLKGAAAHVDVRAVGTVVVATLTGVEARHHFGMIRGGVARPILPSKSIPAPMIRAIDRVLTNEFHKTMGVDHE